MIPDLAVSGMEASLCRYRTLIEVEISTEYLAIHRIFRLILNKTIFFTYMCRVNA